MATPARGRGRGQVARRNTTPYRPSNVGGTHIYKGATVNQYFGYHPDGAKDEEVIGGLQNGIEEVAEQNQQLLELVSEQRAIIKQLEKALLTGQPTMQVGADQQASLAGHSDADIEPTEATK